ncbi:acyltransferase family protein [Aestuariibacter salexigens]|uniref:acyltransferase family protein n=1 Tax=Aestuariibacter salexigens TaxID=226010 RepID=UPI00047E6B54|nr:acyltransferase [Aestuariibacter salexigens]
MTDNCKPAPLPALTGIRFVAIFHIFMYHLWAVFTYYSGQTAQAQGLLQGMSEFPAWLMVFLSNGWVSTSLFFMLSGFILSYLYWQVDGELRDGKRQFWLKRFARIYPVHLVVLAILIAVKLGVYIEEERSAMLLIGSAVGTATLMQAWYPPFVPIWSWPSWTISVLVFLYLLMPYLIKALNLLTCKQQKTLLTILPLISLLPALGYYLYVGINAPWQMHTELFFSNFPLFWVPYFVSGMLLSRVVSISGASSTNSAASFFSLGDVALGLLIGIACIPSLDTYLVYFLRFGLLMPLYMVFIIDLAKGKGFVARLLSSSIMQRLGDIGFSIFIWQAFVLAVAFISIEHFPQLADVHLALAVILVLLLAVFSTYVIEKPLARAIVKRFSRRANSTCCK